MRSRSKIERIRITRHTVCLGRVVMAGEVLDESQGLTQQDAVTLIALKKAVEITVAPETVTEPAADSAATCDQVQAVETPRPSGPLDTEIAGDLIQGKRKRFRG